MPRDAARDREEAMAAVQAMFDRYKLLASKRKAGHIDFDNYVMNNLKLIDASPKGTVEYQFTIPQNYSNLNDVMHGGAAGVIFDMCTTTALCPLAKPGQWEFMGGVTRTLSLSYLRPVPLNVTVRIKSVVIQAGRTMAMIQGQMTSRDGKIVYVTCEHHKVNVPTKPEHLAAKVAWDKVDVDEGAIEKVREKIEVELREKAKI
ncbi:hypothetical protein M501DRAFT_1000942 [Patellaria atrata CBS 101060]|uniref:Thioesterase domain-containing protein n=1 Tax=Patellaria atrata CBS 101060 TaxID=1346257 RepID=A0A9P4SH27_9PEZI|nr:hypothetical protein M501DRAFT_1000942 [Patellaria atrata CBS 101060]